LFDVPIAELLAGAAKECGHEEKIRRAKFLIK
jgi:hypothetical protein